ncbi:MAG: M20 family metallopeptidase [Nitrospirota bacterium]|nr:M20 family metallopeptidase [Nitrospirota bacterium]
MITELDRLVDEISGRLVEIRRLIHQHPEPSGKEEKTSTLVASILWELGIPHVERVGGYGVVGTIKGERPGPTIALRADMDALPLHDAKETSYASQVPGVAHACGHDAHTAMLLGVAMVLSRLKEQLPGNVKLIFQPSEESISGAAKMIEEGVLDDLPVSAIVALHCYPYLPAGEAGIKAGPVMAASDSFNFTISGKGGHASRPHETIDAVLIAAQAVSAIHQIVSRRINPLSPAVITLGTIEGGTARNVIADKVRVAGTMRSLTPQVRDTLMQALEQTLDGICRVHGASYELTFTERTPAVVNDGDIMATVSEALADVLGDGAVHTLGDPAMGSEDFAYYLEKIPGCLFRLGTGGEERFSYPLHHRCFDINEKALPIGVKALALSAIRLLERRTA